jgi:hypothetical protein
MKFIKPVTITEAMLVDTSVAEPDASDVAQWVGSSSYVVGDIRCQSGPGSVHRKYQCLVNTTSATPPEDDPVTWEDIGPTLRWAMFDNEINTQTTDTDDLTVSIAPGIVNSLAVLEMVGTQLDVTMTDGHGGPTIYTASFPLDTSEILDWYGYFFEPFRQRRSVVLTDLPPYLSGEITVKVSGTGTVAIGQCIAGTVYALGPAATGIQAGIHDYSKKTTNDETGVVSLEVRKFAKTLTATFKVPAGGLDAVHQLLEDARATPVVWIADDKGTYDALTVFGFYRDFSMTLAYPQWAFYQLEIEGMI